jgi:hypothetical protein
MRLMSSANQSRVYRRQIRWNPLQTALLATSDCHDAAVTQRANFLQINLRSPSCSSDNIAVAYRKPCG